MLELRKARKKQNLTQLALAKRMKITQDRISRLETQNDWKLSTLTEYFKATGAINIELQIKYQDETQIVLPIETESLEDMPLDMDSIRSYCQPEQVAKWKLLPNFSGSPWEYEAVFEHNVSLTLRWLKNTDRHSEEETKYLDWINGEFKNVTFNWAEIVFNGATVSRLQFANFELGAAIHTYRPCPTTQDGTNWATRQWQEDLVELLNLISGHVDPDASEILDVKYEVVGKSATKSRRAVVI